MQYDRVGLWTEHEIRRLKKLLTIPSAVASLDRMARTPGVWFGRDDVVEDVGDKTAHQIDAELGQFTKFLKANFNDQGVWPVDVDFKGPSRRIRYKSLNSAVAQWWLTS